jgi:hypothetical protein
VTRRIVLVLCSGVLLAGCAAKSAPPADSGSMAPTGGDAMPGTGLEVQEESDDDEDAASSSSEPKADDTTVTSDSRDRSTVASAMDALEEDEVLLFGMLGGEVTALSDKAGCSRACDALRSMKRSVDAICDLAGTDDERCTGAQQRLDKGRARVEGASCGCE